MSWRDSPDTMKNDFVRYDQRILKILLQDRTTKKNIIWATKDYEAMGPAYNDAEEILPETLADMEGRGFSTRAQKDEEEKNSRTRDKAEVFTPAWICNAQNNLVDEAWFGRKNVFNTPDHETWVPQPGPIVFPEEKHKGWKNYVDARRMEISCGEAPYLVSRYDVVTGEEFSVEKRIGLLDRKLRVVTENAADEKEWIFWSLRAFQSIYGYEYQGDNLLLARFNLLMTYQDYYRRAWGHEPAFLEVSRIATVISWNLWQMDALTYGPPLRDLQAEIREMNLFSDDEQGGIFVENPAESRCNIKDWRSKVILKYYALVKGEK